MDTSLTVSIIVAIVAIIPGIWALISQIRKNKDMEKQDLARVVQNVSYDFMGALQSEISRLQMRTQGLEAELLHSKYEIGSLSANSNHTEEQLWKKMYEKPVIVRCKYCDGGNVITNTECIKCGAPLGGKNA